MTKSVFFLQRAASHGPDEKPQVDNSSAKGRIDSRLFEGVHAKHGRINKLKGLDMGLYLCVFEEDDELEGVEVGSYSDFNFFRDAVVTFVENGRPGAVCPLLYAHSDCDGEWTSQDAHHLLAEFSKIKNVMSQCPPLEFNSEWKKDVVRVYGIRPQTLLECFFDIDGEPLVDRLEQLAQLSVASGNSILFQ